jgi:hypothetical protein
MAWRSSTAVGFGIKGKWVIAGYCKEGPKVESTADDYKTNIAKVCVVDGYNKCFNESELDKHNEYRMKHNYQKVLKIDAVKAKELQK